MISPVNMKIYALNQGKYRVNRHRRTQWQWRFTAVDNLFSWVIYYHNSTWDLQT
jgi:hypothetical protein